jgi:RNA polymerase sigma-70 factor (ECF subfamily)
MALPEPARRHPPDFEGMASRVYSRMYRHALQLARNPCDAEDLTHEALYRACRGIGGFDGDKPFENWAMRILTRLYLDHRRRQRRRPATVSSDSPRWCQPDEPGPEFAALDPYGDPERALLDACLSEPLAAAVATLTPSAKEAVWLASVEGLTYEEIAKRLGVPVGTVRSRLHRAFTKLRREYAAAMETTPGPKTA